MPARTFAVIPAAGLSRRMGQPKLLIDIHGRTVIARLLTALRAAGVDQIVVVGRRHDQALWDAVDANSVLSVRPAVDPPDMRASVEQALHAIRQQFAPSDDDCWLLIPADHPVLDPQVIQEVINEWQKSPTRIVIPTHYGERGHPTAIPWRVAADVFAMPADRGLNWLIRSRPEQVREWPTDNSAVLCDLDTPDDLARLAKVILDGGTAPALGPAPLKQHVGGVIVCGGKSTRMGRPKLALPFGDEVMLQRVVRILRQVVSPIVVVAAHEQELPPLPDEILVVRDEYPDLGPLAGIATGLGALRGHAEAAYVTSCDVPLLKPEFIRRLIEQLETHAAIVPCDDEHAHVLAAVYRVELESLARQLLTEQRRRPLFLIEHSNALRIPTAQLRTVDPQLDSLRNVNTPEDYEAALRGLKTSTSRE